MGEVLKLSEPIQIDGQWVDAVVSRNGPGNGYTRAIYEGETVMPYRDGYYPVMYDANFFIEKRVPLKGVEFLSLKLWPLLGTLGKSRQP